MSAPSQIDILLRLVAEHPDRVLSSLSSNRPLATQSDAHGYALVHAAASYGHLDLLRQLVQQHGADVDARDEDGETPLFYAERADVVKCLLEELGADAGVRNSEGQDATQKWEEEYEGEVVPGWVAEASEMVRRQQQQSEPESTTIARGDAQGASREAPTSTTTADQILNTDPPGLVPNNVHINFGTMPELPSDNSTSNETGPDPEIRRRIEELAQRPDPESAETQAELRALVTQVVTGMTGEVAGDADGARTGQRRRVDG